MFASSALNVRFDGFGYGSNFRKYPNLRLKKFNLQVDISDEFDCVKYMNRFILFVDNLYANIKLISSVCEMPGHSSLP